MHKKFLSQILNTDLLLKCINFLILKLYKYINLTNKIILN